MKLGSSFPNPNEVLPPEGVKEVLIQAAASNPIIALLLVALIVIAVWALFCYSAVKWKQLDVMKSPEAAKAMVELRRLEHSQKRVLAKVKKTKQ